MKTLKINFTNISIVSTIIISMLFLFSLAGLFTSTKAISRMELDHQINLVDLRWYAHLGFSQSDLDGFDVNGIGVKQIDKFPIRLNKIFEGLPINTQNEFSVMTTFECNELCLSQNSSLYLAEIGENWSVYLNGQNIYNEIYLDPKGRMAIHRTIQKVIIPIPNRVLQPGRNFLVFRIIGDSYIHPFFSGMLPGFSMSNGYLIGNTQNLLQKRLLIDAVFWFQIGVYFFFGVFQFWTFIRRKESYNLYFGLFLITCVVYSFTMTNFTYRYALDTALIIKYMYSSNIVWPGLIGITVWSFLFKDKPTPQVLIAIIIFSLLSIMCIMVAPVPWVEVILNVSLVPISLASIYIIFLIFPAIKSNIPGAKQLLIAGIFISILVVYANIDWVIIHSGVDLTGWIPFFLTLAFMSIFIDRFWAVTVDLLESNEKLTSIRDGMEKEILARTSEFRNANNLLEEKLKEINRLHSKVYHMALHDTLTGLYNRHFLAETLDREFARASRENHPIGILMIDIDHFKVINDTFGHKAGDEVLKKFGEETLSHIRQEDVAFRYGGEEFLILLPRASQKDSQLRADDLRVMIEQLNFQIEDKIGQITVSVGVAEYPLNGNTPDEVLIKADEALYAAKKAGRNRVEIAYVPF